MHAAPVVTGTRLAWGSLLAVAVGVLALSAARSNLDGVVVPLMIGVTGLLVLQRVNRASLRFPGNDLERGLERLLTLLFPQSKPPTAATARVVLQQQIRLAGLRHAARRWGKELQLITTDGYQTASRLSALRALTGRQDGQALVAEAVRALSVERASAGADLTFASDPATVLAYGLGARPARADLTSLEELLDTLGLSPAGDELRTHFDDVIAAESNNISLHLKTDEERSMFRDLAGASFVLGVSARIIELVSPSTATRVAAAG